MSLLLTNADIKNLIDGITSLSPTVTFQVLEALHFDRCLAPMGGVAKSLIEVSTMAIIFAVFVCPILNVRESFT